MNKVVVVRPPGVAASLVARRKVFQKPAEEEQGER
jgi:hypothetical protein